MAGLDDALGLEAVYYATPIPRDLATLTVLGAVFDKVYFPGVYLPKDGFDVAALDKEIMRLEALPNARTDYDTALLIGELRLARHARTLDGLCVFNNTRDDPFKASDSIPAKMVADTPMLFTALRRKASFRYSRPTITRDFLAERSM